MFGGLGLGIAIGYWKGLDKQKPAWWRYLAAILVSLSLVFTILPTIAAKWEDSALLKRGMYEEIAFHFSIIPNSANYNRELNEWGLAIKPTGKSSGDEKIFFVGETLPAELKSTDDLVARLMYSQPDDKFYYVSTVEVSPIMTYPFIPTLYERVKILNLHVPLAWISVVAYLLSMIYSIRYLRSKNDNFDIKAAAAASLGTVFAILATVTGMLWAKYNWGSYWNWDPRQVSILILILIYGAYFALRSALDNSETRARLSSVYSIIAFITVPFLVFIIPRIFSGLHPGSADDTNAGPVVSSQQSTLDTNLSYSFGFALMAFMILFFWLLNIKVRQSKVKRHVKKLEF